MVFVPLSALFPSLTQNIMHSINAAPLHSTVPPDILDYPTSTDMVVREGSNVTLKCAANGSPPPTITWRREGGEPIDEAVGSVSAGE